VVRRGALPLRKTPRWSNWTPLCPCTTHAWSNWTHRVPRYPKARFHVHRLPRLQQTASWRGRSLQTEWRTFRLAPILGHPRSSTSGTRRRAAQIVVRTSRGESGAPPGAELPRIIAPAIAESRERRQRGEWLLGMNPENRACAPPPQTCHPQRGLVHCHAGYTDTFDMSAQYRVRCVR
jgi:hypothetical protein